MKCICCQLALRTTTNGVDSTGWLSLRHRRWDYLWLPFMSDLYGLREGAVRHEQWAYLKWWFGVPCIPNVTEIRLSAHANSASAPPSCKEPTALAEGLFVCRLVGIISGPWQIPRAECALIPRIACSRFQGIAYIPMVQVSGLYIWYISDPSNFLMRAQRTAWDHSLNSNMEENLSIVEITKYASFSISVLLSHKHDDLGSKLLISCSTRC